VNLKPRIFVAVVIGLFMIGGAFYFSQATSSTKVVKKPDFTIPPEEFSRKYIEVKDTNNDLIPDWQEAFAQGQVNLDGISSTTPFVPETKTGQLVVSLAENYMAAKANGNNTVSVDELVSEAAKEVSKVGIDKQFTVADINIITDNDPASLRKYGNQVAKVILDQTLPAGTKNEVEILTSALENSDPQMITGLDPIITAYEKMLKEMLLMPVPESLATDHLALTNVYQALLSDIKAFRMVFEDAIPTLIRLRRHPADVNALYTSLINLYTKLDEAGIEWKEGDTASLLIKVGSN
jgi:hypothetical protein